MSRTFTSGSTHTRGRGRGRGVNQTSCATRGRGGHSFTGTGIAGRTLSDDPVLLRPNNQDNRTRESRPIEDNNRPTILNSTSSTIRRNTIPNRSSASTSTTRSTTKPSGSVSRKRTPTSVSENKKDFNLSRPPRKSMSHQQPTNSDESSEGATNNGAGNSQPDTHKGQYAGAYTMFSPNEKRRQKIQTLAQKETAAYEAHKKQFTPKVLNHVDTVGGGVMTEAQVRNRQQQELRAQKFNRQKQQEERKSAMKKAEEEKIEAMRMAQRKKAEQNRKKEGNAPSNDEIRRKREEFLQKLESRSENSELAQPTSEKKSSSLTNSNTNRQSNLPRLTTSEMQTPVHSSNDNIEETRTDLQAGTSSNCSTESRAHGHDSQFQSDLDTVCSMFPNLEIETLSEMLSQLGSVEDVIQIILS